MPHVAVIGGSGIYSLPFLANAREERVSTPYGEARLLRGTVEGEPVTFLPRHGFDHGLPPHRIPYRANIWALWQSGVEQVIATAAVGSLSPGHPPGSLALLGQFIDFTRGRPATFFEAGGPVVHADLSQPYCPRLNRLLAAAAARAGLALGPPACYVCTEGPRYETAAEIRMFRHWGGDLVGMTGVPEAVLAREAGLCYAGVALVTNWAAGLDPDPSRPLRHQEVVAMVKDRSVQLLELLHEAIGAAAASPRMCPCRESAPGLDIHPGATRPATPGGGEDPRG